MRTIGSLLLATVLFGGLAVVAGQERSRSTVRRPISSRSSSPLSKLRQRFQIRKRGQQALRFDDIFRSKKAKVEQKQQPQKQQPQRAVSPVSHRVEVLADESADANADELADFESPFEDGPEGGADRDWALESLDAPTIEKQVEPVAVRPRQPIRSSSRRRPSMVPVAADPVDEPLRRGLRPVTESHFGHEVIRRSTPVISQPQTAWSRERDTASFSSRIVSEPMDVVESVSDVELVVPDPIPGTPSETLTEVPRYEIKARPVSISRTTKTRVLMPTPRSHGEMPNEPHASAVPPHRMTRSHRNAAIVARGDMAGFKGFCPVELRDSRLLVDSKPEVFVNYGQRTYYFSTSEARRQFVRNPARYVPAANGADVVMLLENKQSISGRLDHAVWFHNKLYLFDSATSLKQFNANPARYASP